MLKQYFFEEIEGEIKIGDESSRRLYIDEEFGRHLSSVNEDD